VSESFSPSDLNLIEIARKSREVRERTVQLRRLIEAARTDEQAPLLRDTLEALEETGEQLQVVGEELRVQNEELDRTRSAVEEQYHRYLDLFDSAPDGYLVTHPDGIVIEANRTAAEMLRVPLQHVIGRPLAVFVAEEDRREFRQTLLRLREGREGKEWEVCLKPRDGEPFPAALTVSSHLDPVERKTTLRWLVRDVTERKVAEKAFRLEHRVTQTLQRAFLPDLPLSIPGLEVGHLYVPARSDALVGGDFYDLFPLEGGRYGAAMGDVCGKGVQAVDTAAMTKYMLRALASQFPRPADALDRLNRLLCDYLPGDRFVTLFFGVYDPAGRSFHYVNSGHESAILEAPDGKTDRLAASGPILGVVRDTEFGEGGADLPPGSFLLLFTDGLTEARRGSRFLDQEGVAGFFEKTRTGDPQKRVVALMGEVQGFNRGALRDDAALLLLHVTPELSADAESSTERPSLMSV
jgi:sigma-B regulation protein RsbU (phosphoserine phosphatase)